MMNLAKKHYILAIDDDEKNKIERNKYH